MYKHVYKHMCIYIYVLYLKNTTMATVRKRISPQMRKILFSTIKIPAPESELFCRLRDRIFRIRIRLLGRTLLYNNCCQKVYKTAHNVCHMTS